MAMKSTLNTFTTSVSTAMTPGSLGTFANTLAGSAIAFQPTASNAFAAAASQSATGGHAVYEFGSAPYERASIQPPREKGAAAYFSDALVDQLKADASRSPDALRTVEEISPSLVDIIIERELEKLRREQGNRRSQPEFDDRIPPSTEPPSPNVVILETAGRKRSPGKAPTGPEGKTVEEKPAEEKPAPAPFGRASKALAGKISGEDQAALVELLERSPKQGKLFLRHVKAIGEKIREIHFSAEMLAPRNADLVKAIAKDREFVASLIKEQVLDVDPVGMRTKYVFWKLLGMMTGDNLKIIQSDREVGDLVLFQAFWRARVAIYRIQQVRALIRSNVSGHEAIEGLSEESKRSIEVIRNFLQELHDRFPFGRSKKELSTARHIYREELKNVIALFAKGNFPAVDASLVSLTQRLEKDCERQERERLERERVGKGDEQGTLSLRTESLERYAERHYGITFLPDGTWTVPQGGYRKKGPVSLKQMTLPQTKEDKILRQSGHKIKGVEEESKQNVHFAAELRTWASSFEGGETDLAQAQEALAGAFSEYEDDTAPPKVKARLLIDLTRELTDVARIVEEFPEMEASRERLLRFSSSMLRMAARQLDIRNRALAGQLPRLTKKERVLEAIIAKRLARAADFKLAAEEVASGIKDDVVAKLPEELKRLRGIATSAHNLVERQEERWLEAGIIMGREALEQMVRNLGEMVDLIDRKARALDGFKAMPASWERDRDRLKAGQKVIVEKKPVTLATLGQHYRELAQRKLATIGKLSRDLLEQRADVLYQAHRLLHGAQERFAGTEPGPEALDEVVTFGREILSREEFGAILSKVKPGEAPEAAKQLGAIPRADAVALGLRFAEAEKVEAPYQPTEEELEIVREEDARHQAERDAARAAAPAAPNVEAAQMEFEIPPQATDKPSAEELEIASEEAADRASKQAAPVFTAEPDDDDAPGEGR
jgi:hypothetical protein